MCVAIALKLCTWLYIYDLQIKCKDEFGRVMPFKFGFDPLIFPEVMALGLKKILQIISFPAFSSLYL
jgi:hypothetical protein